MAGIDKIARLINWDDVSIFLAISKTGSISKAATLLGRTQPTISKRIENIEIRLGASLFKRTPGGMIPTQIGEAILSHAIAMNRSAASIERMATGFDKSAMGDVFIQCLDGLVSDWIIPKVPDFQAKHKKINLSFCSQNSEGILKDRDPDLKVQFNTTKPMEFVAKRLGTLHYMPYVSRKYKERNGIPKTMEDVVNYHLMYLRKSGLVVETWEKKSRALRELVTPSLSSDNCAVILNAVLNDAGISMLPTYIARQYPDLLLLDYGIIYSYNFWLVQSPHSARLDRVKTVSSWIEGLFDNNEYPWFSSDFIHPSIFSDIEIVKPN
ncbi:MAG TPA: LysR family transcriptional regulator [Gammaproteobacteria bacterium]|nr:LysR family transcriptional regulator [Gammaproteobacteria bacterium]